MIALPSMEPVVDEVSESVKLFETKATILVCTVTNAKRIGVGKRVMLFPDSGVVNIRVRSRWCERVGEFLGRWFAVVDGTKVSRQPGIGEHTGNVR